MSGRASAPAWVVIMEAAEKWGVPPYKVAGGSKLLWFVRFQEVRKYEIKRQEKSERERKLHGMRNG